MLFILVLHLLGVNATQMIVRRAYEVISGKETRFSIGRVPDFDTRPDPVNIFSEADGNWVLVSQDNDSLAFHDLAGEVIFINRWATWCPPCLAEMPTIADLIEMASDEATFLLITDEGISDFRAYENNRELPIYRSVGRLPRVLQSGTIPATFIIDKTGVVRHKHIGMADWSSGPVLQFLYKLNAGE